MVRTINLVFDPATLGLTADSDLAGTSADAGSTIFHIDPVEGAVIDLVADMTVNVGGILLKSPFARFSADGDTVIPAYIMRNARGSIELSVRFTYEDGRIINSEQIILNTTSLPAPEAADDSPDLILTRNSSWEWQAGWEYPKGAVVAYNGILYTSTENGNRGNTPGESDKWTMSVDVQAVADIIGDDINDRLDTVESDVGVIDGRLDTVESAIADETERAKQAEQALQQAIDAKQFPIEDTVTSDGQNAVKSAGIASYVGTKMSEATTTLNSAIISETARAMARENEIEAIARSKSSEITTYAGTVNSVAQLNSLSAEIGDYAIVSEDGTYLKDTSGWIKISGLDARWGNIKGTLADQTDLSNALGGLSDRITELEENPAGKAEWGAITGSITNQSDLMGALADAEQRAYNNAKEYTDGQDVATFTQVQEQASGARSDAVTTAGRYTDDKVAERLTKAQADGYYQAIGDYATKTDISDMLTRTEAEQTYQPIGNYLTEHQSLEHLATKQEVGVIDDRVTALEEQGSSDTHMSNPTVIIKADSADSLFNGTSFWASTFTIEKGHSRFLAMPYNAFPERGLSDAQIAVFEAFANKEADIMLLNDGDATRFAVVAKNQRVIDLVKALGSDYVYFRTQVWTKPSTGSTSAGCINAVWDSCAEFLTAYANPAITKEEADGYYQPKGDYLTEHQSLAHLATKEEISDMLTKTEAQSTYQPIGAYLTKSDTDGYYQPKGDYALKSDITAVYRVKGNVDDPEHLPTENVAVGDVYNCLSDGSNWVYTEEGWDALGATVDLSNYATKSDLEDVKVDPSSIIVTSTTQPADRVGLWIQPVAEMPSYDTEAF